MKDSKMQEGSLCLGGIISQIKFIEGDILTIIDSAIAEDRHNKATKDLVKNVFSRQMRWISSLANGCTNGGELVHYREVEVS